MEATLLLCVFDDLFVSPQVGYSITNWEPLHRNIFPACITLGLVSAVRVEGTVKPRQDICRPDQTPDKTTDQLDPR